ncbi:MAG: peptidase S58 family protein [Anaerolineaceae bacterium]|nr:MAG: peptidase S58 family protein [Anaerolineaceae bacterium]
MNNSITDVPGIEVGHAQDDDALTGCTAILCRKGAVAGVDVRGGAPGTRETDLLNPINLVQTVHAVLLAGGSAFGLDAASGVMRYLEEQGIGFDTGVGKVPIVPAAILFDLNLGRADRRPDAQMGYEAAAAATSDAPREGNFGAGTGASVGKMFGAKQAMKCGVGTASMAVGGAGVVVGALMAVNAFGDVIDPETNQILAGLRSTDVGPIHLGQAGYFGDTLKMMKTFFGRTILSFATKVNTVIGVVATNADFTKADATKMAQMAHDGLARAVRPAHTMLDGDTIFALATGGKKADVSTVGAYAAEVTAQAIVRAARMAASAGGLPGLAQS